MISVGSSITKINDELKKIPVRYLYDALVKPRPSVESMLRQLRIVRQLNPSSYAELKRRLPYFVCGIFNPPFRKKENFAYTEYFVIDIDHIDYPNETLSGLREKITSDDRVLLCFTSPGNDGLKILMRLKERCYDANIYKTFYKLFTDSFSNSYNLSGILDSSTCDATRACFISVDRDAYFNPEAKPVDLKAYIDVNTDISQALDLNHKINNDLLKVDKKAEKSAQTDPDKEIIDLIRQRLNPKAKLADKKKPPYVPEELENLIDGLKLHIESSGVTVTEITSIQYGKKIKMKMGTKAAELNIFFGRKGFSVIQSPRTGTDPEMNALMADVVENFIFENT